MSGARPRHEVATWDEVFMEMAHVVAKRSKDPKTQVGACIVSGDNKVLSLGYNGTPRAWHDDAFPWDDTNETVSDDKHLFVVHAERNAVLNYNGSLQDMWGGTMYSTHSPCNECAKEIAQVGIRRVVYVAPKGSDVVSKAARLIFELSGVRLERDARS